MKLMVMVLKAYLLIFSKLLKQSFALISACKILDQSENLIVELVVDLNHVSEPLQEEKHAP